MQKIRPFLWFDHQAEEAMHFYTSIFKNSRVGTVQRYGEGGPGPEGSVMSVTFELEGQQFFALNGGPHFSFTPAISFFVNCDMQQESRRLLGKTLRGRRKKQLRVAQGQVWRLMANHSLCVGQDVARQGPREIDESHEGDASNEKDRHRGANASLRKSMSADRRRVDRAERLRRCLAD